MLRLNRILLASDFSPGAEAALHYAAALARQAQARLTTLHVLDTRIAALPRWSDIFRLTEVFAGLESDDTAALARLMAHPALAGLTVDRLMRQGNPATHIVDLAAHVDLVVMGSRGAGSGWGKTSGSVARSAAHDCPTPVLLVPEGGGSAGVPAVGAQGLTLRRILLALHFAQYAPQAVALARTCAAMCQASLHVLQVIEPDRVASYPLHAGAGLYHNLDAAKVLLRKRLGAIVPDEPSAPAVQRLVVEGHAAEVIVQQSTTLGADLIIMSAHAYGTLKRFFTVSTVDAVIERASCPLLTVPFPQQGVH